MYICYIDESGDSQAVNHPTHEEQPMLIVAGLFVDAARISRLTDDFIRLKRSFYPNRFKTVAHSLDVLLTEIKGSDIRADIRKLDPSAPKVQHHLRFLDGVLALCNSHDVKVVSRVWVKAYQTPLDDRTIYSMTAQHIAKRFQHYLIDKESRGMMIADFRDPARNQYVSHSIFTQKHKLGNGGDAYPSIEETAVFGVSNNHACLQIADLVCSTILYPIAGRTVCNGPFNNVHTHKNFDLIVQRYTKRIRKLQYHCSDDGRRLWGITVRDPHNSITSIFPTAYAPAAIAPIVTVATHPAPVSGAPSSKTRTRAKRQSPPSGTMAQAMQTALAAKAAQAANAPFVNPTPATPST
jgi:hypothetical protein